MPHPGLTLTLLALAMATAAIPHAPATTADQIQQPPVTERPPPMAPASDDCAIHTSTTPPFVEVEDGCLPRTCITTSPSYPYVLVTNCG